MIQPLLIFLSHVEHVVIALVKFVIVLGLLILVIMVETKQINLVKCFEDHIGVVVQIYVMNRIDFMAFLKILDLLLKKYVVNQEGYPALIFQGTTLFNLIFYIELLCSLCLFTNEHDKDHHIIDINKKEQKYTNYIYIYFS